MIRLPFGIALGRWREWTEAQAELGTLENVRDELLRQMGEWSARLHLLERLHAQEQSQERSVLNPCD